MSIPMVDLKQQYQNLKSEIEPAVCAAMDNAHYVLGPNVQAFEQECADYLGVKHTVAVASGTDALHLALRACGVGPGDEVITPSFTFIATVEAILYCGATPVFIDIEANNFNLDLAQLATLLTEKSKAILPVHLYGNPVAMDSLMAFAKQHDLKVIEDCAQSFGATWQEKQTGSFGDAGCFSFYPSKNLSCFGDGGLVSTNDDAVYKDLIALRNHGSYTRYHHEKLGYNSRLDEIQAVVLRVKLKHIDAFNQARAKAANMYAEQLADLVTVPTEQADGKHIYHQYTILHPQRDKIQQALREHDIASAIYYPLPIHKQPLFKGQYDNIAVPVTVDINSRCLSLPMFPELTKSQIDEICQVIRNALS
jgi:dTDP-4-amino-4,6-dideoxygalactose transaminase